jgi:hypothetical protein
MRFLLGFFSLALSLNSFASSFQVGTPQLTGPGCPAGSATAVVAPDSSSISILFDNFAVNAPKGKTSGYSSSCVFSIPILQLPPNKTLSSLWIDYRGFINLPKGAYARIITSNRVWVPDSEAFPQSIEDWFIAPPSSPLVQDFYKRVKTNQGFPKYCSTNTKIEVKTNIEIMPAAVKRGRKNIAVPYETDASLVIDTADMSGRNGPIQVGVGLEACSNDRNTGGCLPDGAEIDGAGEDQSDGYREFEDDRCCSGVAHVGASRFPRCGRPSRD